VAFFATSAGTNETIFGFTILSLVVCAPANGCANTVFLLIDAGGSPGRLRGTNLSSDRNSSKEPKRKTAESTRQDRKKDMGAALRSVYEKTVREAIPDEMLDLLGKLD